LLSHHGHLARRDIPQAPIPAPCRLRLVTCHGQPPNGDRYQQRSTRRSTLCEAKDRGREWLCFLGLREIHRFFTRPPDAVRAVIPKTNLIPKAILRFFYLKPDSVLADTTTHQVIGVCQEKKLTVTFNCYLTSSHGQLSKRLQAVRKDGRFNGFILYETADFIRFGPDGACSISNSEVVDATKSLR
jgi:hypothetical protein